MSSSSDQSAFFRGIYEFEDPSGTLIASKIPVTGSLDLYSGSIVMVKPNQKVIFVYKNEIADTLSPGNHEIQNDNVPLLSNLANWKFGFKNPLRCELVYVSTQLFTARRWGTPQPILLPFKNIGTVPVRCFGQYSFRVLEPKAFYSKLFGSQSSYGIIQIEDFIQGQITELLGEAFSSIETFEELSKEQSAVSKKLEVLLNRELKEFGLAAEKVQLMSALPSKEILDAMDAKSAIQIIGSQKQYLLYKAATSLGQVQAGDSNDPLQMMMGLMLGKGLMGQEPEPAGLAPAARNVGPDVTPCECGKVNQMNDRFCSSCGKKIL
jgi:membrane protease subunit (stomatin/prohibitin family)